MSLFSLTCRAPSSTRAMLGAALLTLAFGAPAMAGPMLDGDVRLQLSPATSLVVPVDRSVAYGKWACVNAKNPFSGRFLREGAVPRDEIMREMMQDGASRIRIVAGPCQTRFYGSSDAKEVMHVFSTISGEWVQSRDLNKFTQRLVETRPLPSGEARLK